jgi:hypothetical protein
VPVGSIDSESNDTIGAQASGPSTSALRNTRRIRPNSSEARCGPLFPSEPADLQAECRVLCHRLVGEQGEGLEHHAHLGTPRGDELPLAHCRDLLAIEQDPAGGGIDEAVEHAHQRRLTRAGKTHHHEDIPFANGEIGVADRKGIARPIEDLFLDRPSSRRRMALAAPGRFW